MASTKAEQIAASEAMGMSIRRAARARRNAAQDERAAIAAAQQDAFVEALRRSDTRTPEEREQAFARQSEYVKSLGIRG